MLYIAPHHSQSLLELSSQFSAFDGLLLLQEKDFLNEKVWPHSRPKLRISMEALIPSSSTFKSSQVVLK